MRPRLAAAAVVLLACVAPVLLWDASLRLAVARDAHLLAEPAAPRRAAAEAELRALGAAAVPDLVQLFIVPNTGLATAVHGSGTTKAAGPLTVPIMDFLRTRPDAASLDALIAALDQDDSDVRHYTGLLLAWIGAPAVPPLERLVREAPQARRRTSAAWILSLMGADGVPALPALQAALQDGDQDVRLMARYAIGQLSPGNEVAWEMIRRQREQPR